MSLGGGGSRRRKAHRKSRAKSGEAGVWSLESEFNRDKVHFAERDRTHMKAAKAFIAKINKAGCVNAYRLMGEAKKAAMQMHSRRLSKAVVEAANKAFDRRDAKCRK